MLVCESINDILKPKSKEEIEKLIQSLRLEPEEANKLIFEAVKKGSVLYVRAYLRNGANVLNTPTQGVLWFTFNNRVDLRIYPEERNKSEMIIIELLKNSRFFEENSVYVGDNVTFSSKDKEYVKYSVLEFAIYLEYLKVLNFILDNYPIKPIDINNVLNTYNEGRTNPSESKRAKKLLKDWLKKQKTNESIGDILKPKSEEEIKKSFKQASISDQVGFLEIEKNRKIIPEKDWPLIVKIWMNIGSSYINFNIYDLNRVFNELMIYSDLDDLDPNGIDFEMESQDFPSLKIFIEERNTNPNKIRVYLITPKTTAGKKDLSSIEEVYGYINRKISEFKKKNII